MRILMATLAALLLAGCGSEQRAENEAMADINAAAQAAQGDIDTYAADTLQPTPPATVRTLKSADGPDAQAAAPPANVVTEIAPQDDADVTNAVADAANAADETAAAPTDSVPTNQKQ